MLSLTLFPRKKKWNKTSVLSVHLKNIISKLPISLSYENFLQPFLEQNNSFSDIFIIWSLSWDSWTAFSLLHWAQLLLTHAALNAAAHLTHFPSLGKLWHPPEPSLRCQDQTATARKNVGLLSARGRPAEFYLFVTMNNNMGQESKGGRKSHFFLLVTRYVQ